MAFLKTHNPLFMIFPVVDKDEEGFFHYLTVEVKEEDGIYIRPCYIMYDYSGNVLNIDF